MGKSRIIVSLVVILHTAFKSHGLQKVCIAFPSRILLETDREVYEKLKTVLNLEIHLSVGFDEQVQSMTKNDLLILDEGDQLLLYDMLELPKSVYGVLAMTATDVNSYDGHEFKRFKDLRFELYDSKIAPSFDPDDEIESIDLREFLDTSRSRRARIVWC